MKDGESLCSSPCPIPMCNFEVDDDYYCQERTGVLWNDGDCGDDDGYSYRFLPHSVFLSFSLSQFLLNYNNPLRELTDSELPYLPQVCRVSID